jgi:Glycosyltransferase sugar-binding region containing DXD motif
MLTSLSERKWNSGFIVKVCLIGIFSATSIWYQIIVVRNVTSDIVSTRNTVGISRFGPTSTLLLDPLSLSQLTLALPVLVVDNDTTNNSSTNTRAMTANGVTDTDIDTTGTVCPTGQLWVSNVERNTDTTTVDKDNIHNNNNTNNEQFNEHVPMIPKIIHQTCKSRCLSEFLVNTTKMWQNLDGWSYYLHDDTAMLRLINSDRLLLDFPHLQFVANYCITSGTIRADLWRYLVLWEYGGLYADIDAIPNSENFNPHTTIKPSDEAFFVVEHYGMLSQYFLASRPRHPILWYTINDALIRLLTMVDTGAAPAHAITGPHALHRAFMQYRKDVNILVKDEWSNPPPIPNGAIFAGTENTTITVVGNMTDSDHFIIRDATAVSAANKAKLYKSMGMIHYHEQKFKTYTNETCLSAIRRQRFHSEVNNKSIVKTPTTVSYPQ